MRHRHAFLAALFAGTNIVEAKHSSSEAQMEQDCDAAFAQIEEKQYAEGLYGYRTILCYGVAFYKKSAVVKKG